MSEFHKEIEDYFCRFTFGQFVALILLELVTLFFVFYLGARYGGELIGRKAASEAVLPADDAQAVDELIKKKVDYTYPEVLTEGAGDSKAIRVKPSGVKASALKDQPSRALIRDVPIAPPSEPNTFVKAPSEFAEPARPVAVGRPASKFAIQVGSFPAEAEASAALEKWRRRGYEPFLSVGEIPNRGVWYRVRLGGYATRDEAKEAAAALKVKEKVDALVVLNSP